MILCDELLKKHSKPDTDNGSDSLTGIDVGLTHAGDVANVDGMRATRRQGCSGSSQTPGMVHRAPKGPYYQ
ncbi:hypothetical protein EYF80_030452 [Liparis tanakae]|uniref:Uncharacterized protein n=1 Tax=Liparis tanakae TaxID=230148 RepID=A0A4Z2H0Q3_9TELE|nr:hypothetical protein EYF80_030452 [Liparis tanakae]